MTRILLTGGSGFLGAHVLETLLSRGHSVVTTVRNEAKAEFIEQKYVEYGKGKLEFAFVSDIAAPGAFDEAVKSDPPFEAVIHSASPYFLNATDVQKELLDPAINGTVGILKSIKLNAPTVKKVVITSSFAAMWHPTLGAWPGHTYSEEDWNPVTHEQAISNPGAGYAASKKFAEQAAWDFVSKEQPGFELTTINPPMIYGPVIQQTTLEHINTSNTRFRDAVLGRWKEEIPPTGLQICIDVRDAALAHVLAAESGVLTGKRVLTMTRFYSNKEIVEIIRKNFPEFADKLPGPDVSGGGYPDGDMFKVDNSRLKSLLNHDFMSFEQTTVDVVKSLKPLM